MPAPTATSHVPVVLSPTSAGDEVTKLPSNGASIDARHHFASTYSVSYGRFDLPTKPYRPFAASVALTTKANPLLAPTADVKQSTGFTENEKPFLPYRASIDRFATDAERPENKYTSEAKANYQPPNARQVRKTPSDFKDSSLAASSFTRAYRRHDKILFQEPLNYSTAQKDSYGETSSFFTSKSSPRDQAELVDEHPKPDTAFTQNAPKKHQFGDGKFVHPTPEKVKPKPACELRDAKLDHDGFTREFAMSPIQRAHMHRPYSTAFGTPMTSPGSGSAEKRQLINPMNPLSFRTIHLKEKRVMSVENEQVTGKVGERNHSLSSKSAPATPLTPSPVVSSAEVSPTSPKHTSGALVNAGDEDFLRIRGRHVHHDTYVTEMKGRYQRQKPGKNTNLDVIIHESAFTKGNKIGTSPWRHLLKQLPWQSATLAARRRLGSAAHASPKAKFTYPLSLVNVPETRVTTLGNGMRVASEHADAETATVGLWIGAGSRFETAANNGVAHFLEHMAFKGTPNRSRVQIESEIENMGAQLNAYTSREQTVYYARCLKKDVPRAVDILSDILQNSTLDPHAIEAERDTILREKEEVEKQMEEVIFDHLHATAYQGTSLGMTILGPEENIKKLQRKDLENYIKTHYTADRMVLVGAGGVDHDQLCKLGDAAFKSLRKGSSQSAKPPATEFIGSEIRIRDDTAKDAHIAVAVEGVGWTHPDHMPLLVAQTIVGSWDRSLGNGSHLSSKLAQAVASNDLANSFTSFNTTYSDTGLFGLYLVGHDRVKLIDLAETTLKHWRRICTSATEADVERAKNQLKTSLLFSLDSSVQVAEEIGRHMLFYGRRVTPFEINMMVDAVTPEVVRDVAMKYLYDVDPAVVAHGPIEAWPDYVCLKGNMIDPLF